MAGSRMKNLPLPSATVDTVEAEVHVHWSVVKYPVQYPLLGTHLDSEPSRISCLICTSPGASDGRESHCDRCPSALLEYFGGRKLLGEVRCYLEIAMSTCSAGVDNTFRDSFSVERCKGVDLRGSCQLQNVRRGTLISVPDEHLEGVVGLARLLAERRVVGNTSCHSW